MAAVALLALQGGCIFNSDEPEPTEERGQLSARITATSQQVGDFFGTRRVRLVFINDAYLFTVDFSQDSVYIERIENTEGAVAPVVSPDGNWVTYASGVASDGKSATTGSAWVWNVSDGQEPRKLVEPAYVPRFVQNSSTPTVIYSTCGQPSAGKDHSWDGCGKVLARGISGGSDREIFAGGTYQGGLSWDERYLATAESSPNAFLLDLQGGGVPDTLHTLRVKKQDTDEDTVVTIQACNPSISSSRIYTNAMMYFDFSSQAIATAGCYHPTLGSWGFHTRIFIGRNDGEILRVYDVPVDVALDDPQNVEGTGEILGKRWNYPEWSNHPCFAASAFELRRVWKAESGGYDETWRGEAVYAIDLKDSTYIRLLETTDTSQDSPTHMRWPWIWIETGAVQEESGWLDPRY